MTAPRDRAHPALHCACGCACHGPDASRPRVPAPAERVLGLLSMLGHAVAVTGGGLAALTQAGHYGRPSLVGGPLMLDERHIGLRLDHSRVESVVLSDDEAGGLLAHVLTGSSQPAHRLRTGPGEDRLILESIGLLGEDEEPWRLLDAQAALPPPASELGGWWHGDHLAQLDAIIHDGGAERRAVLREQPAVCRTVAVEVLPELLEYLAVCGQPLGAAAIAPGAMQAVQGPVHAVHRDQTVLRTLVGTAILDVDLRSIEECLLVRSHGVHGSTSTLELYSDSGSCELALTQFGAVPDAQHAAWERMLTSLPAAE